MTLNVMWAAIAQRAEQHASEEELLPDRRDHDRVDDRQRGPDRREVFADLLRCLHVLAADRLQEDGQQTPDDDHHHRVQPEAEQDARTDLLAPGSGFGQAHHPEPSRVLGLEPQEQDGEDHDRRDDGQDDIRQVGVRLHHPDQRERREPGDQEREEVDDERLVPAPGRLGPPVVGHVEGVGAGRHRRDRVETVGARGDLLLAAHGSPIFPASDRSDTPSRPPRPSPNANPAAAGPESFTT